MNPDLPSFIPEDFSFSKTLFCPAPGRAAVLVTRRGRRYRTKHMRFKDAHAALTWCIANGAALVYFPVAPESN